MRRAVLNYLVWFVLACAGCAVIWLAVGDPNSDKCGPVPHSVLHSFTATLPMHDLSDALTRESGRIANPWMRHRGARAYAYDGGSSVLCGNFRSLSVWCEYLRCVCPTFGCKGVDLRLPTKQGKPEFQRLSSSTFEAISSGSLFDSDARRMSQNDMLKCYYPRVLQRLEQLSCRGDGADPEQKWKDFQSLRSEEGFQSMYVIDHTQPMG